MAESGGCAQARELLPELAAGVASGDERAAALRHLAGCVECRAELDAMATVADELLTLAPSVEPPGGFESAVLKKLAPRRRRRWRRVLAWAMAVALAAVLGGGTVMRATAEDRRVAEAYRKTLATTGGRYLTAKPLADAGSIPGGRLFAYQGSKGNPSWVFVIVKYGRAAGSYQVRLVTKDGRDRPIGTVKVSAGQGSWGVIIDVPVAQIAEVRLTRDDEPTLTASFR